MHSPWGLLYQMVKETGWSRHEILWKESYGNLMLMMADRPDFKRKEEEAVPDTGRNLAARFRKRKGK